MVVLLGFATIVVDVGWLYAERRQLQNGADAAALAVAIDCAKDACAGSGTAMSDGDRPGQRERERQRHHGQPGLRDRAGLSACTPAAPQAAWDCPAAPAYAAGAVRHGAHADALERVRADARRRSPGCSSPATRAPGQGVRQCVLRCPVVRRHDRGHRVAVRVERRHVERVDRTPPRRRTRRTRRRRSSGSSTCTRRPRPGRAQPGRPAPTCRAASGSSTTRAAPARWS